MPSSREQWYAEILRAGLETRLLSEADILAQAKPSVLVASLPKDLLTRLLAAGITSGTVSPASVMETATPEVLAAHVPHAVLWASIARTAEQNGFTRANGSGGERINDEGAKRDFLRRALDSALATTVLTPKDIMGHVDASILIHHFPDDQVSKLLETSLAAGKIDPAMVVDVIGVAAMSKHAPIPVLWACLAQAGDETPVATRPAAPVAETRPANPPVDAVTVPEPAMPTPVLIPQMKSAPLFPQVKPSVSVPDASIRPSASDFEELDDTNVPIEVEEATPFELPVTEPEHIATSRKSGLLGRLKR